MNKINSHTVVFITGAFVSNSCWDQWKAHFLGRGYTSISPAWPHKDAPAATLRSRHPDAAIASIRLKQLIDHYSEIIKRLPEQPILIGHSLGGLLVQILLNNGLGAAGIAIHSVPPQGIFPTQFSFFKSTWKALGLFTSTKKSYMMSFKDWKYAFTNGMTPDQQKAGYERYAIPESKLALRDGLTSVAKVDFKKRRNPLLFIAGNIDHCIPAALNRSNYKKYKNKDSITEYKEFGGRNHFVLGQPTWKEEADYIMNWVGGN